MADRFSEGGIAAVGRHSRGDTAASWRLFFFLFIFFPEQQFYIAGLCRNRKPIVWLVVVVQPHRGAVLPVKPRSPG